METILIRPKSAKNAAFIKTLLKGLNEKPFILTEEEVEDFFFGKMMEQVRTGETVPLETLKEALRK